MADAAATTTSYPEVGVEFTLTLDGSHPDSRPLAMVRAGDYTGDWQHNGPTVQGMVTKRFKLVQVGYCRDLAEVKRQVRQARLHARGAMARSLQGQIPHV